MIWLELEQTSEKIEQHQESITNHPDSKCVLF